METYPIDPKTLSQACDAVIDALEPYHPSVKIAALHTLIDTFPETYLIAETTIRKQQIGSRGAL
jgi:hypothetical protein